MADDNDNASKGNKPETPSTDAGAATPRPEPPARRQSASEEGSSADVVATFLRPGRRNVMLVYVLYLAGLLPTFAGIPLIPGFVIAVPNRDNSPSETWRGHYEFQVRQAIIGLIAIVISFVLAFVIIGFLLAIALLIWWLVRSVKGLQATSQNEAIADPKTYTW